MERVESTTIERWAVTVTTSADPSGGGAPEFSATTGARVDPGTWVAGTWVGGWSASDGKISAYSPTIGAAGAGIELTAGLTYDLWIRWTVGAETPVLRIGTLWTV